MNSLKQTAEAVRNQYSDLITLLGNFIAENCRNVMVLAALIALAIEEAFETLTDRLCNAGKNERSKKREGYRNGHKDVDYKLFGYVFSVRMPIVTGKDEPSVYPELKRQAARQASATELGLLLVKKGLSYKDAADVASRFLGESVSRSSIVNWLGPALDREVEEFRERDLSLIENVIMFVDALYRACMVGGESEKMAQYVSTCIEGTSGERVLLDVSCGMQEKSHKNLEESLAHTK